MAARVMYYPQNNFGGDMRRSFVLCLLFLLSAVAAAGPRKPVPKSEPAVDPRIAAAQKLVTDSMNDPESTRFRNVALSPKGRAVCGQVNAKNAMGGYVGFRRFIVSADQSGIEGDGTYFAETHWDERCVNDVLYSEMTTKDN